MKEAEKEKMVPAVEVAALLVVAEKEEPRNELIAVRAQRVANVEPAGAEAP